MKPTRVLEILAGSVTVYCLMAACGGDDGLDAADGGAGDGPGSLIDALTNPVKDAKADGAQSGSRLKAKFLSGSDGSKEFLFAWRDTQRNEDCKYRAASDAKTRCLPVGLPILYYADSGCTQPLINVVRGCPAGSDKASPYAETTQSYNTQDVLLTDGGPRAISCGTTATRSTLYSRGAAVTTTTTGLVYRTAGTCVSAGAIADRLNIEDLYALGSEVPPSAFVEATVSIEP